MPVKIAWWSGAEEQGDTGLHAVDGYATLSVFEAPALPDFSSPRFPDLAELDEAQRIQRVADEQGQLLSALHTLSPEHGITLRYVMEREPGGEGRIRLFLIGRAFSPDSGASQLAATRFGDVVRAACPGAYRIRPSSGPDVERILRLDGVQSMVEILKTEQWLPAWHDQAVCGFTHFYYPLPMNPAQNDMVSFCRTLATETLASSVTVDITLVPARPLTEVERQVLKAWEAMAERWSRDQHEKVGGGLFTDATTLEIAADPSAAEARKGYQDLIQRYGSPSTRCFLYAIRVLWGQPEPPTTVASALAARALASGAGYQFVPMQSGDPAFARALAAARLGYVTPAVCNPYWSRPDAPETIRRAHRMVDLKEIAGFFRLPIPGRDGCPGFALDTGLASAEMRQVQPSETVDLGRFVDGGRLTTTNAGFALGDLAKHCLIVGTPGSGKTTLCQFILTQLWEDHRIPFIVLEPAKTEYRALKHLDSLRDDMLVFTVGNERTSAFRFNPFEVMDGESVSEHISSLNSCFAGAFDLFEPLPMILDRAIRECYADRGWSEYGLGGEEPGLEPPTMANLYGKALEIATSASYKGETAGNIRGALEMRLGSLLLGPKGRCFNTRCSVPTELLMKSPVVLELDALNDDEKALMMMFLLARVRAYAKIHPPERGTKLRHVVLVEEAHNVIGRGEGQSSGQHKANPKEVAIRFFTRMLAEVRAWGEGILIADQLPTAIAIEAIKSTNIKVMHRVVALDDRKELGQAMVLTEGQMEQAATLTPGASFVFMEGWAQSRLIQEPDFKRERDLEDVLPDTILQEWMGDFETLPEVKAAYIPFTGCEATCERCNRQIRERMERWANRKLPDVRQAFERERQKARTQNRKFIPLAVASGRFFEGLTIAPEDDVTRNCAFQHFENRLWNAVKAENP